MFNETTQAVISGAVSGLGRATAEKIIKQNGRVVLLDINEEAGQKLASELGGQAVFIKTDISDEDMLGQALSSAQQHLDRINLAVNCAGILGAGKILGKKGPMEGSFFSRVLNINLLGSFLFTKILASLMEGNEADTRDERGVIIHTASIAAYEGQLGQVAYSATKAGVIGMILPAARELSRYGIRIMALAPGMFDTPMLGELSDDIRKQLCASVPFPARFGQPDEFAGMVETIYNNQMLNGSVIRLDGAARLQ